MIVDGAGLKVHPFPGIEEGLNGNGTKLMLLLHDVPGMAFISASVSTSPILVKLHATEPHAVLQLWPRWHIEENIEKISQLTNGSRVKHVDCPTLLTVETGRARRNHSTNTL